MRANFGTPSQVIFGERCADAIAALSAAPVLLGDVDLNGTVNFLDISPFIELLTSGVFQDEADLDRNEVVNFLDTSPFIVILSGQ